jgi:hypothetical protein
MDPRETHPGEIGELLSAAFDGEASEQERLQAIALTGAHPELAAHVAFLDLLKDSATRAPAVEVPATLSERIAQATYARPTLWSRLSAALRPAPVRYATAGLALSGLAALGLFLLRPGGSTAVPGTNSSKAVQLAANPSPAPVLPTPQPPIASPAPPSEPAPTPPPASTPLRTPEAPIVRPPVEIPAPTESIAASPPRVASSATPAPRRPAPTPMARPSPLPPARLAEPPSSAVMVAMEPDAPAAMASSELKAPGESEPVIAQPRAATTIATSTAAAHGDPTESPGPKLERETIKITLNQSREKLAALSAQPGANSASGNRISLVSDAERR